MNPAPEVVNTRLVPDSVILTVQPDKGMTPATSNPHIPMRSTGRNALICDSGIEPISKGSQLCPYITQGQNSQLSGFASVP